jgi:hypothetical protein
MNNENNGMEGSVDLTAPTTKMLAIGSWTKKGSVKSDRLPVMLREVPATVRLYLTGAIEQWYIKPDISGVVFVMNITNPTEAHAMLEKLPLGVAGMMTFEFIPLGPITPLRFLLKDELTA